MILGKPFSHVHGRVALLRDTSRRTGYDYRTGSRVSCLQVVLHSKAPPKSSRPVIAPGSASTGDPDNALYRGGDPDFMTSLARGLHVIRAFSGVDRRLTIADVSRATGLTRAVVRRCLYTLRELGYAATDGRTYRLQPRILNLGYAYLSTAPIPIAAQPVLEELSERLGEATSVAVLDDGAVVYVARAATRRIMAVTLGVGSRLPAYCTALGRVLLASLPLEQTAQELAKFELVAHTRFTVTSRRRLEEILAETRSEGFAVNDQELEVGLRSIAVPVRNVVGVTVAAMNVSTQASRVSRRELLEKGLPLLKAAAERLGSQLPPSR
ncbi:MAG TPA: IclR family transcriptional regulator C-terminal domain-containing protein [Steroidobacteraceae bacterium]|nr:IclR family transcriptional regulator C-terminal domain-containing protein [Steroidobacteraceae bacterium]